MTDRPVNLYSSGPPETVIEPEPAEAVAALVYSGYLLGTEIAELKELFVLGHE